MKKIAAIFITLCLLLPFSAPVYAASVNETQPSADTEISTLVPENHTITVDSANASVFYQGKSADSFTAERLSRPRFFICPNEDRIVTKVTLNDRDITGDISGGYYTADSVCRDIALRVETAAAPRSESGSHTITGTLLANGKPLSGVTLEIQPSSQQCVTGEDGSFRFENVEGGHHTLTALKDGLAIGYTEFTMNDDSGVSVKKTENGFFELSAPKDIETLSLALDLSDDGLIAISGAKAAEDVKTSSPKTGDTANILLLTAFLIASACAVAALKMCKKAQ